MGKRARTVILTLEEAAHKTQTATTQLVTGQKDYVLAKINAYLCMSPSLATQVLLLLESGQLQQTPLLSKESAVRYQSQNKLRLIPRDHMLEFFDKALPALACKVRAHTTGKPTELLVLALNMDPSSALFSKHIATNMDRMLARHTEMGKPLEGFGANDKLENLGFFTLLKKTEAEETRFTHLKHISGSEVALPTGMQHLAWVTEDNLSSGKAALVAGIQTSRCTAVFDEGGVALTEPLKLKEVAPPGAGPGTPTAMSASSGTPLPASPSPPSVGSLQRPADTEVRTPPGDGAPQL